VSVEVSPSYSAIQYANAGTLMPGENEVFDLASTPYNDAYFVRLSINSTQLRLVVVDRRDVITKNPNPVFLMNRVVTGAPFIDLPTLPSKEGISVILDNEGQLPVTFGIKVFRLGQRPSNVVVEIKKYVEHAIKSLDTVYKLPRFKVQVKPCGVSNAFSNPDIVICTELLAELIEKDLALALYPILFHELAHSLLYLWDLPGYDNEDVADEFATVFLSRLKLDVLGDYLKWLELNDSVTEAVLQLTQGDRHTLSVQRARNMRSALANSDELTRRWGKLLSQFERKKK
jgi:hypothetical protein